MKNNRKLVLSTIALSVLAVTSAASNAAPQAQLNKAKKQLQHNLQRLVLHNGELNKNLTVLITQTV